MTQYLDAVHQWQPVNPTDPTILTGDPMLVDHLAGGAATVGSTPVPLVNTATGLLSALANDPNAPVPGRDSTQGFFNIPMIMQNGTRVTVRVSFLGFPSCQTLMTCRISSSTRQPTIR